MTFPNVIRDIILGYVATWELLPWIDIDDISWGNLVRNPNAVDIMIKHPGCTRWGCLSQNSNHAAFYYMRANMPCLLDANELVYSSNSDAIAYVCEHISSMYDPARLSRNPLAIPWLEKNPEWINWDVILSNPAAKDLLTSAGLLDKIPRRVDGSDLEIESDMMHLCENHSTWAMDIVRRNIQSIWRIRDLMRNPYAGDILSKCGDVRNYAGKLVLDDVEYKKSQLGSEIERAKKNPKAINWYTISANPDAIEFLKDNQNNIKWKHFSRNPAIFELRKPDDVFELL